MEGLHYDFIFMSLSAYVLAAQHLLDLSVDERLGRSRAHLKATEQLHTLDTLSMGTREGGCEGPRSGGEDRQETPDIVLINIVCVVVRSSCSSRMLQFVAPRMSPIVMSN